MNSAARAILIALVIYAVAVAETVWLDALSIGAVAPDLMALAAIVLAVSLATPYALVAAAMVGLAADLLTSGPLGAGMAAYALAAFALSCAGGSIARQNIVGLAVLVWPVVSIEVALVAVWQAVCGEPLPPPVDVIRRAFGVGAYTALVSLPVWMVRSWIREPPWRRIEAL